MSAPRFVLGVSLVSALAGATSCGKEERPATSTFYERKIGPILQASCATSPAKSSCHVDADDRGNALGNLNVESYDTLNLRRDLLIDYGPYGIPGLLLKVAPPFTVRLTSWDNEAQIITTNVAHAGGSLLDVTSPSYAQLERWIDNGATENNAKPKPKEYAKTPCGETLGIDPLFDAAKDPPDKDFAEFSSSVNGLLGENCAAGNCHGNPANSLYLTCGSTPEQVRWNYFAASNYVSVEPTQSEILRRVLSTAQGGTYHEGGAIFSSPDDSGYEAILSWATAKGGPSNVPTEPGFLFFAKRVQPMLVKRGCMMLGCHSASLFHDYRLRGGSGGHFGLPATRRNYELSLEQVALESPNPNVGRIIRKNLSPSAAGGGILHRGGSLFAGAGDPAKCDLAEAETGDLDKQDPYCVIVAWIEKERTARMPGAMPLSAIVYVKRPPAPKPDTPQDWAVYAPGADLLQATASLDASGNVTAGSPASLLGGCGLNPQTADVRRPAVSWDGKKIAFSARSADSEPFRVYVIDGSSCSPDATINAPPVDDDGKPVPDNGERVHNFDPAFAPDGRIVFTSTRGNTKNVGVFGYKGPTRTPADPSRLNTNLYVSENGKIRQLTFLLNQELSPAFMGDGRLILITEKRAPGFYQLAGRRQNLDGGDYHPLFGQRGTIGYNQFTDVVELADKNLAAIFSEKGAVHGAGTLAIINRSIGVDQPSKNPDDYAEDPAAMDWQNPQFFQRSIKILDPAATGRGPTKGAYRSPAPLPNGKLLVSYAPNVVDVTAFDGKFEIVVMDPITGQRTPLLSDGSADLLWPVAVYARGNRGVFKSRIDEANGATTVYTDDSHKDRSEITFVDVPMIATLLFQNTRAGRRITDGYPIEIWENLPPEPGVTSFAAGGAFVTSDKFGELYIRRRKLGAADPESDGSLKVQIPGGVPITLATHAKLVGDAEATKHFQREEMQFYPGEWVRQSFRRDLFNGMCGGCHGSVSGRESDIAVNPDILTQASQVEARAKDAKDLTGGGGDVKGPPFD